MSKPIPHTQGPCPVSPATIVRVTMENGDTLAPMEAKNIDWDFAGDGVTSYEIVKEA